MESFCEAIRRHREAKGLPLRTVAAYLDIDQAILSKIETGSKKASREQVVLLARFFGTDEKIWLTSWLADKILYEIGDEEVGLAAMKMAEEKVKYQTKKQD